MVIWSNLLSDCYQIRGLVVRFLDPSCFFQEATLTSPNPSFTQLLHSPTPNPSTQITTLSHVPSENLHADIPRVHSFTNESLLR